MVDARRIPFPIQWHEGMMLAPQHFQQSASRQEELLHYHLMSANPFHYGVRRLKIDPVLLVSGKFRVLELEAILPDGLIVEHGHADDASALELELEDFAEDIRNKPLLIHLALPEKKVGAAFKGDLARFDSIEGQPVTDENTGDNEIPIPRLKPRLLLLATDDPPQKYVSFPLAEVTYKNETFAQSDYLPPSLAVSLRSPIGELCQEVSQRLREKAVYLSEQVQSPSSSAGAPMILETKNTIHSLVSGLPQFEAVLNTGASHPFPLYVSLCHLVGQMASLGTGMVPPVLPAYNHNDIRFSFDTAREFIFRMIEEGINEAYTGYPFTWVDNLFALNFAEAWMKQKHVYLGVRGPSGMGEKEIIQWIEKSWIGTVDHIPSMREKRILGPERKAIEGDRDIIPARGVVLFELTVDPEFIEPEQPLQIFNTTDTADLSRPMEILLYVKTNT